MLRIGELVALVLIVVPLALTTSAAAQAPKPAPPPRVTPVPHPPATAARPAPAPAARPAPPPRMAAPPPHPGSASRMAAPPPRVAPMPPRLSRAGPPPPRPQVAAPPRGPVGRPQAPPTATRGPSASPQLSNRQQRTLQREERRAQTLQAQQAQGQRRVQQRQERADRRAQEMQQRLEQRAQQGRLTRSQQRRLQSLQEQQGQRLRREQPREQMRQGLTQQRQQPGIEARQSRRAAAHAYVTPQVAAQNRFAGGFHRDSRDRQQWTRARREHWAAHEAWRRGIRAAFIPWYGPVYWPYAYSDIFDYTFWPYAYDDGYWASAYDDFLDGVFFPYGAPYVADAYSGPYDIAGVVSSGSRARGRTQLGTQDAPIGGVSTAARQVCEQPGNGVTAWPIEQIADVVRPNDEQRALLDDLKNAGPRAADAFRNACPTSVPTPVGRLQAMMGRLRVTLDAVHIVRPPLEKFYDSLSDEQKARFNAMGPEVGRQARIARTEAEGQTTADQQKACVNAKPGLADLPIDRIDDVVRPTGDQEDALARLGDATQKAVDTLQTACPTSTPLTPVGRLDATEQRLNAMLTAAKAIQPALENFYASLNSEQKARFNELDRDLAGRG
jgi:hypothetical protein